jgi:hypothetical protein
MEVPMRTIIGVVVLTAAAALTAGGGNLHWYHVHRCAGIINNGDAATISASYAISPRQVITSP